MCVATPRARELARLRAERTNSVCWPQCARRSGAGIASALLHPRRRPCPPGCEMGCRGAVRRERGDPAPRQTLLAARAHHHAHTQLALAANGSCPVWSSAFRCLDAGSALPAPGLHRQGLDQGSGPASQTWSAPRISTDQDAKHRTPDSGGASLSLDGFGLLTVRLTGVGEAVGSGEVGESAGAQRTVDGGWPGQYT